MPRTYAPVVTSLRMIERPSGPTAAMTAISFVPGGKLTTSVPGSAPSSTLRFVVVDCCGALTSGFVLLGEVIEGVVVFVDGAIGATRAIGTPITTTYTARNAPTKPRPNCTKCWKSPPAPYPLTTRFAHYEVHENERQRAICVRIAFFPLAPRPRERQPDFRTRSLAASSPSTSTHSLLITRDARELVRWLQRSRV